MSEGFERESRRKRTLRSAAWLLLGLACVLGPWLLGGYPPEAGSFLAALTALALGAALARHPGEVRLTSSAVAVFGAFLAALGFTLLQRLPLPCGWVEHVAADSVGHRREVARLLGALPPTMCTISEAPGATELALVRGASPIAAFFTTLLLLGRRHARERVLTIVALTGAGLALVGLVHRALGLRALFGLYTPVFAHPSVVTPLFNGNNLAGLLLLTMPPTFALAARATSRLARYAMLGLGGAQTVVIFMTESRGGIAALLAVCVFGGLALMRRRRESPKRASRSTRVELAVVFVASIGLGTFFALDGVLDELRAEQEDPKLVLLERGAALALRAPPFGFGRGAFGPAVAETFPLDRRVEFAENVVIQRVADWGLPFALLFLAALSLAFARAAFTRRSRLSVAAALGLLGLALQNLVDFSLELPGIAVPAAMSLAVIVASGRSHTEPITLRPVFQGALLVALGATSLLLGPMMPSRTADAKLAALRELASTAPRAEPPWEDIDEALRLHPRDPAITLLSAHLVRRSRPDLAGPWLNRSLELSPYWASTHLEIARWLLARGHGAQAAIHLSRAAALDVHVARDFTCALIDRGFAESALRAAPEGKLRGLFLERALSCVTRNDPRSPALEALALEVSPDVVEAQVRRSERDCASNDEHLEVLRKLTKTHKTSPRPHLALARCLVARKEHKEAKAVERTALTYMPQLRESFARVLRGASPRGGAEGDLDPKGQVGEGVFLPPATHSR
jgi:hypothetical protein